ncbi:DUF4421 family protein [Flavobacterium sp. RSB2_4_14]|uniref:DUF4421 family protein n=1 Tax=Flavobacterium sp. RSB2_4_14 TaxID=3447665 RepID=UPI003F3C8122
MKKIKIILSILTLFSYFISVSQTEKDTIEIKIEPKNLYLKSVPDYISIKFDLESNNERFEITGTDFDYDIRPNVSTVSRLSVNYSFISFSFRYLPKFFPGNNDNDLKGKTKGSSFGLTLNFNHWVQELKYGKVTGFYLENSQDYVTPWIEGTTPYIQFPELKVTSFRGATSYKFNSNFSLKAISTQTEIQLKSAGSFIPGLIYSYFIIDNQSNSINQSSSQRSNNYEVLANFGYYYTFVLNRSWYVALGVSPSIGYNYTDLLTRLPDENIHTNYSSAVYRINGKSGLGFNSERFFGGLEITAFRSSKEDENNTINQITTYNAFQFFVGYRFNAPKKVQELVQKAESRIQL